MNERIGGKVLVPRRLAFGRVPRIRNISTQLPGQNEGIEVPAAAQAEISTNKAERKIRTVLNSDVSSASDRVYKLEEEILAYSEKDKK